MGKRGQNQGVVGLTYPKIGFQAWKIGQIVLWIILAGATFYALDLTAALVLFNFHGLG